MLVPYVNELLLQFMLDLIEDVDRLLLRRMGRTQVYCICGGHRLLSCRSLGS